ncbi:MAG TPA: YoaK family protein [Candidatus Baltobacteraceae bacterium]
MGDVQTGKTYGPLLLLLSLLTLVTGFVDAVSFLKYGHVFVANMTGNVVFLGFAIAGAPGISISGSLIALAAFLCGAVLGGRLGLRFASHRANLISVATSIKFVLIVVAAIAAAAVPSQAFAVLAPLGISMGIQNAMARRLAMPDLTTTVLTLTITGIAADSSLAGGTNPRLARRIGSVLTMFVGAFLGGWIVLHTNVTDALSIAAAIVAVAGILAYITGRNAPAWVRPD